jgi:hypothetical protein
LLRLFFFFGFVKVSHNAVPASIQLSTCPLFITHTPLLCRAHGTSFFLCFSHRKTPPEIKQEIKKYARCVCQSLFTPFPREKTLRRDGAFS